eukprot:4342881-Pyramimonas_sp.AAC.1
MINHVGFPDGEVPGVALPPDHARTAHSDLVQAPESNAAQTQRAIFITQLNTAGAEYVISHGSHAQDDPAPSRAFLDFQ